VPKPPLHNVGWTKAETLSPKQFQCGFCGSFIATNQGWRTNHGDEPYWIRICTHCSRPTYGEGTTQYPGVAFGAPVMALPPDIDKLYEEARTCCSSSAYTAAVLLLRKLLMNAAVGVGAKAGGTFIGYIEYLSNQGYVPPNGKGWVDHIRLKGNEANHEITLMEKADAEELVVFSEMLLKFIWEFPQRVPQKKS